MTEHNVKMNEKAIHSFFARDINLKDYCHRQSTTGDLLYEFYYHVDHHGGLVKKLCYPKGFQIPWHWHHCGHGFYVLQGQLVTSAGTYGPGDFVWFDAGVKQWHGAGKNEDLIVIFVTDGPCDMNYLNPEYVNNTNLKAGVYPTLAKDLDLNKYPHKQSTTGKLLHQFTYHKDKFGGLVKKIRYDKGTIIPWHWHHCGHGFYVLKGTLYTNVGTYKPGDFVWFDPGVKQWHGAGKDEDVEVLFTTDGPCDMNYIDDPTK